MESPVVNPDVLRDEIVSKVTTPWQRKDLEKTDDYEFSSQETNDYILIRDAGTVDFATSVYDKVTEKERSQHSENNWQASRDLLNWYSNRNTYNECGMVEALQYHDQITASHVRYLIKEAPFIEKVKAVGILLKVDSAKVVEAFTKK